METSETEDRPGFKKMCPRFLAQEFLSQLGLSLNQLRKAGAASSEVWGTPGLPWYPQRSLCSWLL